MHWKYGLDALNYVLCDPSLLCFVKVTLSLQDNTGINTIYFGKTLLVHQVHPSILSSVPTFFPSVWFSDS